MNIPALSGSEGSSGSGSGTGKHHPNSNKIRLVHQHRDSRPGVPPAINIVLNFSDIIPPKTFNTVLPIGLAHIHLKDMDDKVDKVYEKRLLFLTLIEDPLMGWASIHLVGQDENGEATRLYIYNVPQNDTFGNLLAFGTQVGIVDPYHRIAMDGTIGIRVDEPTKVIHLGRKANMCRFCGEDNAQGKCSKCGWASYCNRKCQAADWKVMNHKFICRKKL